MKRIKLDRVLVVEGRDDVNAAGRAVDALIIPTHGFGITQETWNVLAKADAERGLIILTDPDFSGEEIRRKLTEKFPNSIQAYISQNDALLAGDIGVENAKPEVIRDAIIKALENGNRAERSCLDEDDKVEMKDLVAAGLAGGEGSAELRKRLCGHLGIGYANSRALYRKLVFWGIGKKELEQAIEEITK